MSERGSSSRPFIALIPAYKPSDILPNLVIALTQNGMLAVVVDDGSGKDYETIFEACSPYAEICVHEKNKGKGCAIKTGLSHILQRHGKETVVVTVDADGQHTVKDALAVCTEADRCPHSLVIGSRRFTGKVPLRSRFGNAVTRFVYRVFSGVRVYDTQTGLRAFTGDLISKLLAIHGERYEYEMNMLLDFAKQGIVISENEIETIYENDNSSSHFKPVRDSVRIYAQILKFSSSSLVGFVVDYILYGVMLWISNQIILSNIVARLVSATVNFTVNRKFVFKSEAGIFKSALRYAALAIGILAGNTLCLRFLVETLAWNQMLAKIIVEIGFFLLSWLIQKTVVFKRKSKGDAKE